MVVKRGEGAAMLQYPDMIESFLEKVFSKMTVALSVKMRLGMHSPDEIRRVIPVINSFPVKEIIIHPRTGVQMYDGVINHEAFDAALLLSRHPVIYNGDIRSAGDYTGLQIKYPSVSGWMIGRGLLMNPFLAMEIKNGRDESDLFKTERLKQFTDYLCDAYIKDLQSPAHVLDKMKGVWHYLSHSFNDSRRVEKKIRKAGSLNHYRDEVRRLFEKEAGQLSRA
jgi:tRNA-dihydrouridine synthase